MHFILLFLHKVFSIIPIEVGSIHNKHLVCDSAILNCRIGAFFSATPCKSESALAQVFC